MKYHLANETVTVAIDFMVNGDFVVPDVGSVRYSLRDNDGNLIGGYTELSVVTDETTNRISLTLSASVNSKTKTIEKRTLAVRFNVQGEPYVIRKSYFLIDWLNITATEQDVRNYIGISEFELSNDSIDLVQAYFDVVEDLGSVDFNALLTAGTRTSMVANRAVIYKATFAVLPSLRLRINQKEQSDTLSVSRLADVDLDALESSTSALYEEATRVLQNNKPTVTPVLIALSTPVDPVTGA